jgi:glycosyltransferase involved in cell wall biosynthesis
MNDPVDRTPPRETPLHLSLCMITRDEEAELDECLRAAADVVDEIVILDTGSTDRTLEIARAHGARVYRERWHNDFASARNAALAHCRGRWILSLDADERLDYVNGNRLLRATRLAPPDVLALAVVVESDVGRRGSGVTERHVFPRVFRNDPAIRWDGPLHEQLVHLDLNLLEHARLTDVVVRHHGYVRAARETTRRERNAEILAGAAGEETAFRRLARAHSEISLGRREEGIAILDSLIGGRLPRNLDATARWSRATALLGLGRRAAAREALAEARERHPDHAAFTFLLGQLDLEDGRIDAARASFDALLESPRPLLCDRTDVVPSRATIEVLRARTDLVTGRVIEALRRIERALAREPGHAEGRFQRAVCLEALGRCEEAVSTLESLRAELPGERPVTERLAPLLSRLTARHVPGLSVCILARDEAPNLAELIPSLLAVADEVIVVDTGSSDGTPEAARRLGATVVAHDWTDDFARARNAGLDAVGRRWVLWLDADERLAGDSAAAVRKWVARDDVEAVSVILASPHGDDDPVAESAGRYCRLFRADVGARFEGRVHEQILPALERRGARVMDSDIRISHLGYALDAETMRQKKERNLRLLMKSLEECPDDPYTLFQLGTTLAALGDFARALPPLRRSLAVGEATMPREIRIWTHLRIAQAAYAALDLETVQRHARRALEVSPGLDLGDYLMAAFWSARGRPARGLVHLRRILRRENSDPIARLRRDVVARDFEGLRARLTSPVAEQASRVG